MKNKIELLAPAGDLEKAKFAINFGANAIYLGGKIFSLRAQSTNFTLQTIKTIINYAHKKHCKVYIVVNILCHNSFLKQLKPYLLKLKEFKPDGLIVADPFVIQMAKKYCPNIELHLSTQQSITNHKAALFFKKNGIKRIITAREVNCKNLTSLCKNLKNKMDVEYFVHGALCVNYSGKCMLSNHFALRDANVGGCAQCCRWNWTIFDKNKKLIGKDFSMSLKDNCLAKSLVALAKTGVNSLKIEGRMKTLHYLATVVNSYRHLLDKFPPSNKHIKDWSNELLKAAKRPISDGCFLKPIDQTKLIYHESNKPYIKQQNFVFIVTKQISKNKYEIISKNYFTIKNEIEILSPNCSLQKIKLKNIYDIANECNVNIVNKPMFKYIIEPKNHATLKINDLGRIYK